MIQGLLLAGGAALRFGANKLLHPLPGGCVMGVAAARHLMEGLPGSLAVVRPGDEDLAGRLQREGLQVVFCRNSLLGMGHSIGCGVNASAEAGGWVLALADMPFIRPATIAAVAGAIEGGAAIAVVEYDGQRGHPVGFGAQWRAQLLQLRGDAGARSLIARHAGCVVRIPV
ncbi:MAG: nucleotidyltransferase family protein, partial [Acidiferrobacterales bacterium]